MTFKKMILVVAVLLMVATVTMSAAAQEAVSKNKGTTIDPKAKTASPANEGMKIDSGMPPKMGSKKPESTPADAAAKKGGGKDASATPPAQEGKGIVKGQGSSSSRTTNTGPVEDPPYLVPLDKAKSIVKAEFPDSKIASTVKQYITIKEKSGQAVSEKGSNENKKSSRVSDMPPAVTPAYIFTILRTDSKALYQMTVLVNGMSGEVISPQNWLINDGVCGPHYHPPGVGTHWHVCTLDKVWRWDPPT
jgi:hypothetical protein